MKKAAIIFFSLLLASGCSVKEQGIMAEEIPVKTYEVYSSATKLQLVQNAQAPYFDAYHDTFVMYTFEGKTSQNTRLNVRLCLCLTLKNGAL